jgi:hypothetical protein
MVIFEIVTPGTWIDSADRDWSWKIQNHLRSLKSHFFEANLALNLFLGAQSIGPPARDMTTWQRDSQRRAEISREIEAQRGGALSPVDWEDVSFETDVSFKREQWCGGQVPREFEHKIPFIYARAFLYALDAFEKFLGVLVQEPGVPLQIADLHRQVTQDFPDLRGVRNTTQHLEDRARGLGAGREPKPLVLQPVKNSLIAAPSGALVLDSLNGSKYSCTMADGCLGEVDVCEESMRRLQRILEAVLKSFQWRGPKEHSPAA